MGGKYPIVAFGGVSADSCWNPLQDGIDYSERWERVNRGINHANMRFLNHYILPHIFFFKSLHWDLLKM